MKNYFSALCTCWLYHQAAFDSYFWAFSSSHHSSHYFPRYKPSETSLLSHQAQCHYTYPSLLGRHCQDRNCYDCSRLYSCLWLQVELSVHLSFSDPTAHLSPSVIWESLSPHGPTAVDYQLLDWNSNSQAGNSWKQEWKAQEWTGTFLLQ